MGSFNFPEKKKLLRKNLEINQKVENTKFYKKSRETQIVQIWIYPFFIVFGLKDWIQLL